MESMYPHFPLQFIPLGYAYILTHPGTPTVFYDHYYQVYDGSKVWVLCLTITGTWKNVGFYSNV